MIKAFACLMFSVVTVVATPAMAADSFSVAEQKVFLDHHLNNIKKDATLKYDFHQSGKPEDSFEDKVQVSIKQSAKATGAKTVDVDYLSGIHKISLPNVGDAQSNPVILYFLEMDVRDMHRLVGGQEAYFRKRIRLALADAAEVRPVTVNYGGRAIAGSEVRIAPYLQDPLKERLGNLYKKSYVFTLSNEVPGGLYQIRTQVDDPAAKVADAPPLMQAVLTLSASGS